MLTNDNNSNDNNSNNNSNNNDRVNVCSICRRSENQVDRMFTMAPGLCLCGDCMQKSMDSLLNGGNFQLFGMTPPGFGNPGSIKGINVTAHVEPAPEKEGGKQEENGNSEAGATANEPAKADDGDKGDGKGDGKDNNNNGVPLGNIFSGLGPLSNILFGELPNVPQNQRLKRKPKKKKEEGPEAVFDITNLKSPHVIKAELDDYVVGQEYAKKVISVAVYNHYKRVFDKCEDGIELEKSNMLMIGPTGCGKTYLVKTLARLLNVPLAIADATSLTEAGYIGDDVESVLSKLLVAADNDVEKAEKGIVFIDEIDKLAKKHTTNSRDVSGESVQQGLLKLLEGAEIEVPVGASSKNAMVPMTTIDTSNILFICGGAFPDLEKIIKQRLNKTSAAGFLGELSDKYDKDEHLLSKVEVQDIREFGMIPEFIGRLPVIFTLDGLKTDDMVRILTQPKNAIIKQYQKLLAMDEVELSFEEGALRAIAEKALERDTGARALRAVIEKIMLDIMYEIPKDESIGKVIITEDYVSHNGAPQIVLRSNVTPLLTVNEQE